MKAQKAAAVVKTAASKFGPAQLKQANTWLERAQKGEMSSESLIEEQLVLFGECELSPEGASSPNKCVALSKALDAFRLALGDVEDQARPPPH